MKDGYLSFLEFCEICAEFLIDPSVAMESESVRKAHAKNDRAALRKALSEAF